MKILEEINEETRLSLGLILGSFSLVTSGVVWMTMLYSDVSKATLQLKEHTRMLDKNRETVDSIDKRLSWIEWRLGKKEK